MATVKERNAAFDAAKAVIVKNVPAMFQSYIEDKMILALTDAALKAAEKVRNENKT
jgi:hypothetical protein